MLALILHLWELCLSVHSFLLTKENQLWKHLKHQNSTYAYAARKTRECLFLQRKVKIHWRCLHTLRRQACVLARLFLQSYRARVISRCCLKHQTQVIWQILFKVLVLDLSWKKNTKGKYPNPHLYCRRTASWLPKLHQELWGVGRWRKKYSEYGS